MPLSSYKGSISGTVGRFQFRSIGVFSGWRDLTIKFVLSDVVEVVHLQEQLKEACLNFLEIWVKEGLYS